jgi:hypothetical protein
MMFGSIVHAVRTPPLRGVHPEPDITRGGAAEIVAAC